MAKNPSIVWDIGNVLYPYSRVPEEYYALCYEAYAKIAQEVIPVLSAQEAQYLVGESYKEFHDCYGAFLPVILFYGLDLEETRLCLFQKNFAVLYELLRKQCPAVFGDTTELVEAFRGTLGRVKHGILSQSCTETFGIPLLDELGLLPFFEPKAILGLDQVGFVKKAESIKPLLLALERMEADPGCAYFVEDTLSNLERAAEVRGLRGIYINHGKLLDPLPSFVSNQFKEPVDFLRSLKECAPRLANPLRRAERDRCPAMIPC
ncbi:MAG: HAD family hydrolase [Alphaproteobacteria bacterium]|nr:HAD family hydrolase [Alphaproteobacteria bacterium]